MASSAAMRRWVVASFAATLAACGGGEREPPTSKCSVETVRSAETSPCLVPIATYVGTLDLVISVAWSPVDDFVLSGANGQVRLLSVGGDPPAFSEVAWFLDQGGRAFVAWSPDGELALTSSTDVRLLRVDRASGTLTQLGEAFTGHLGDIYALAWSPDGTHALSVGEDGTVRLLRVDPVAGPIEVAGFDTGKNQVYDVAFAPSGTLAAIANQDGTLRVLSVDVAEPSLTEVARKSLDGWATAVAWSPRDDEILAGSWLPCGTVELESFAGPGRLRTASILGHHTSGMRVAHFAPNGDVAITAGHDDTVELFSLPASPAETRKVATWADNAIGVHAVSLAPDGRRMVVAASHADRLTVLDSSSCSVWK